MPSSLPNSTAASISASTPADKSGYILIVDDNPNNLRLLISLLSDKGYEVRPANTGARALSTVEKEKPELVLLDINMPEMDGYEVCRRLKADPASCDIPVLFISANDEPLDKVKGFEAGAVDYISKPFDAHELHARVRTHLELKQARDRMAALNSQLQDSNAMLQGLNQIKDEFLGMVSHDLKNPLSSILLFSRYMESRSVSEAKAHEIGRLITSAGRRMFRLIEDLLDLNKLEQGMLQLEPEVLELQPLLKDWISEFSQNAADKQQSLSFQVGGGPFGLVADPLRLRQVLDNLISNALKFSPPGSEIVLRLEHEGEKLVMSVQDQGPGLSSDDQVRLFHKFTRLSARPTANEHSSGLGLFIAKKLVEAMQGEIWCQSTPGQGACFKVAFEAP